MNKKYKLILWYDNVGKWIDKFLTVYIIIIFAVQKLFVYVFNSLVYALN